jgi:tetratricopeptide (TPR) repeat protein
MKRLISSIIFAAIFSVAIIPESSGQQGGQPTGTGTGDATTGSVPGSTAPKATPPPVIITAPPTLELPPREMHPIYMSGSVMREDGSLPPFGAIIEMDCGGAKTREAIVSPNGRFSFQYGGAQRLRNIVPDASDGFGRINDEDWIYWNPNQSGQGSRIETTTPLAVRLSGCDLRAQIPGYRSSVLRLNGANLETVNELGDIVVYPLARVKGTVVSVTSLSAPKAARNLLQRAQKAFQKEKYEECEALLQDAVGSHPQYGEAWLLLGQAYQRQNLFGKARDSYQKAIETDSLYVTPYVRMGWLSSLEQKWQEAADITEQALDLDPVNFPDAYYLNALANYNLRNWDHALKRAEQAIRRDSDHQFPNAHLILANLFLLKNDSTSARTEMLQYLKFAPNAPEAAHVRARLEEPVNTSRVPR